MHPRRYLSAATLALALLIPASAHAVEIGVQDDQACVYNFHDCHAMLATFREMGGTHVRINVIRDNEGLSHATLEQYDSAVEAVRAHGLVPQLTLVWRREDDPARIARWMGEMAAHFAPAVDRYSVLNEPDLTLPAADLCDPVEVRRLVASGAIVSVEHKIVRRLRYRGRVTRIDRKRYGRVRGRRVRVYRYKHRRGHYRKIRRVRVVEVDERSQSTVTGRELYGGCLLVMRGRKYGAITRRAVPAIRHTDPGAQVLAGETSPLADLDRFIDAVGDTGADAWAHHPYDWDENMASVADVRRWTRLPVYATEFGVSIGEGERLPASWARHVFQGSRQVVQYQWYRPVGDPGWDTSAQTIGFDWLAAAIAAAKNAD